MKNSIRAMEEGEAKETMTAHEKLFQHQSKLFIEKANRAVVKILLDLTYLKCKKLLVID